MKTTRKLILSILSAGTLASAISTQGAIAYDQNVTANAIYGSGNINGSWAVDQNALTGVELGLRAKQRVPAANIFNSDGLGTYNHSAGAGEAFNRAKWSFEWSINSDYLGTSGLKLDDLRYVLRIDTDPSAGTTFLSFDPINGINPNSGTVFWDHSIGDNTTGNGAGAEAVSAANYATLIGLNNLAQQSWRPHFFFPINPNASGTYTFELEAFDSMGGRLAFTTMDVVVPEPSTYIAGAMLLLPVGVSVLRKMRKSQTA